MSTYLSWDVGIKNLAYCIINKVNETEFKIEHWGIINLADPIKICTGFDKKGKPCKSKACYEKDNKYYCKKHSKQYVKQVNELKQNNIKGSCVYSDRNEKLCGKNASYYINDDVKMLYCKTHGTTEFKKINKQCELISISKTNANKIPVQILALKMLEQLSFHKEFIEVDEVLIENQPTLRNPTMKTISVMLYSYFVWHGMSEKKEANSKIKNVKFISPSNKLKICDYADKQVDDAKNDESKDKRQVYILTKELGIKLCTELIKTDEINTKLINDVSKKDDMCDAFLQGYHYIYCQNGVPKETTKILNKLFEKPIANSKIKKEKIV